MIKVVFEPLTPKHVVNLGPIASKLLDAYVRNYANSLLRDLRRYPPPPADSRYQRTGTLGASWQLHRAGVGFSYTVTNDAADYRARRYARYVQGSRQVWYHAQTGWLTVTQAIANRGGPARFRRDAQNTLNLAVAAVNRASR